MSADSSDDSTPSPIAISLHDKMTVRVGRDKRNDLILNMANVSRFHAVFSASSAGVLLSDLSSTNGTFVNETRITMPVNLKTGDVIQIGFAKITIELSFDEPLYSESIMATEVDSMKASVVTVLVADVRNYTGLTEALPETKVADMLHLWLDRVSEVVRECEGEIDKYIGDCVMAIWRGTDDNAQELAIKAANAAIEIVKATTALSEKPDWGHHDHLAWQCRVSLNTGQAMVGLIGGRGTRDFTALGDIVNVAFRLDSIGSQLGLDFIASAATAKYIEASFKLKNLGLVAVKGRKEKVEVFTLADRMVKE